MGTFPPVGFPTIEANRLSLRSNSVIIRRDQPKFKVPLNIGLSPESLQVLNSNNSARWTLTRLAGSSLLLPVEVSASEFTDFIERNSNTHTKLKFSSDTKAGSLLVPPLFFLLPFPSLLLDYLKGIPADALQSAVSTPLEHVHSSQKTVIKVAELGETTPFLLAMWGNHPSSAQHLVNHGAAIELPSLAYHMIRFPYSSALQSVVTEFVTRADADPTLWTNKADGEYFLLLAARVERTPGLVPSAESVNLLCHLLDNFLEHIPDLASQLDSKNRDPIVFAIIHCHKHLFDWILRYSDRKHDLSQTTITKAVSSGNYECLEWKWTDGTPLKPFHELVDMCWLLDSRIPNPPNYPKYMHFDLEKPWFADYDGARSDLTIYSADLIHFAIRFPAAVRFFHRIGAYRRPLKAKAPDSRRFSVKTAELALSVRADESAMFLLSQKCECDRRYIDDRIVFLKVQLVDQRIMTPTLEALIRFFATSTTHQASLLAIIPDLPCILRWTHQLPIEKLEYLFAHPCIYMTAVLYAPTPFSEHGSVGSHLHIAVRERDVKFVELLVRHQVDLLITDWNGDSALHKAVAIFDPEVPLSSTNTVVSDNLQIIYLLLNGARSRDAIALRNANGLTPSIISIIKTIIVDPMHTPPKDCFLDVIGKCHRALTGSPPPRCNYWSPLSGSILHDLAHLFVKLAKLHVVAPVELGLTYAHLWPVLSIFCQLAQQDCLESKKLNSDTAGHLLEWDVNYKDKNGRTALDIFVMAKEAAAAGNLLDVVQRLSLSIEMLEKELGMKVSEATNGSSVAVQESANLVSRKRDPRLARRNSSDISPVEPTAHQTVLSAHQEEIQVVSISLAEIFLFAQSADVMSLKKLSDTSPQQFREGLSSKNDQGNLPLHLFAGSRRFRKATLTEKEESDLGSIVGILSQSLSPLELNVLNNDSMSPLAISIFEDSFSSSDFFLSSRSPPMRSPVTLALEKIGCNVLGIDSRGKTVVHGALGAFLTYCNTQQRVNLKLSPLQNPSLRILGSETLSACIAAYCARGVDVNHSNNSGHTPLDVLCAEAGPAFFSNGIPITGAMNWTAPENSLLQKERSLLISDLVSFGAKKRIDLLLEKMTSQPAESFDPMDLDDDMMNDDDGSSDAGKSDISEVIMSPGDEALLQKPTQVSARVAAATLLELPPEFQTMVSTIMVSKIRSYIEGMDDTGRRNLMLSRDSTGCTPLHILASTTSRFRRTAEDTAEPEKRALEQVVKLVVPQERPETLVNNLGLTPLACSILADSQVGNLRYSLFSAAKLAPRKSIMTTFLEEIGLTIVGVDEKGGGNVIHGAVKQWLIECVAESKSAQEGKPLIKAKDLRMSPERLSSAIASFLTLGTDINQRDKNGHTPLDLLIAVAGPTFLELDSITNKETIDWDASHNSKLKQYRDGLVEFLKDMGAKRGLDVDLESMKKGVDVWSRKRGSPLEPTSQNRIDN